MINTNIGFAGTTWLQRAMFHESAEVVHELMNRTPELDRDRNFLGQTPLHVAIDRKLYFEELLNAGHYVDVTDNCGITPLMYAAAMGETSFAESLLRRGADPFIISDQKYHERDFVAFAMGRKQWTFLLDLFENIQELYEEHVMHDFATRILMQFMSRVWNPNFDDRLQFCSRMTRFCKNINFVFDDPHHNVENMTLMHCIRDVEEGKVLVQAGYDGFDRANSKGHVPLATIASLSNAPAFTFCLQNTDINANPTIRRHVTLQLVASLDPISHENMWDAVDSIRSYLRATSGCSDTDGCTCPCGPQGCGVSSMFDISFGIFYTARRVSVVWTLEWLLQVKAFHGEEAAKNVALGLIRRLVVDKLGIKHTCCHDGHGLDVQRPSPWEKTDTNIANGGFALQVQDEDVIEKLEAEMSDLSDRDLPSLFNICMKLVKQKYDTHLQEFQEESRQRQREKHTSCSVSLVSMFCKSY